MQQNAKIAKRKRGIPPPGIMIAWSMLMPVVTGLGSMAALLALAEYDRWTLRRAIIFGAITVSIVIAVYFLMENALLIPVPNGLLF
jgi:hypothetical protein